MRQLFLGEFKVFIFSHCYSFLISFLQGYKKFPLIHLNRLVQHPLTTSSRMFGVLNRPVMTSFLSSFFSQFVRSSFVLLRSKSGLSFKVLVSDDLCQGSIKFCTYCRPNMNWRTCVSTKQRCILVIIITNATGEGTYFSYLLNAVERRRVVTHSTLCKGLAFR